MEVSEGLERGLRAWGGPERGREDGVWLEGCEWDRPASWPPRSLSAVPVPSTTPSRAMLGAVPGKSQGAAGASGCPWQQCCAAAISAAPRPGLSASRRHWQDGLRPGGVFADGFPGQAPAAVSEIPHLILPAGPAAALLAGGEQRLGNGASTSSVPGGLSVYMFPSLGPQGGCHWVGAEVVP